MTQKYLGMATGFPEKNADVRMAQYESGTRTPKSDLADKRNGGQKMILYRPVGEKELDLIIESNYRAFPPRLSEQPIFLSSAE